MNKGKKKIINIGVSIGIFSIVVLTIMLVFFNQYNQAKPIEGGAKNVPIDPNAIYTEKDYRDVGDHRVNYEVLTYEKGNFYENLPCYESYTMEYKENGRYELEDFYFSIYPAYGSDIVEVEKFYYVDKITFNASTSEFKYFQFDEGEFYGDRTFFDIKYRTNEDNYQSLRKTEAYFCR